MACLLLGCLWDGRAQNIITDPIQLVCKLHGQTRRYQIAIREAGDTLRLQWKILRNGHWQEGSYTMLPQAVEAGSELAFLQPEDKQHVVLSANETFALLSRKAYRELKDKQACRYNGTEYRLADMHSQAMGRALLHAVDATEGCEIWVLDNPACPLVWKIQNNPLEINWQAESLAAASSPDLKEELTQTPEKTAGIYYAYPGPADTVYTPAPDGYIPFYISHYGRHGSRWITDDERYLAVIRVFDSCKEQSGLTPLGEDVRRRLQEVWEDARGRSGELTPVGERQHRDIAERLYRRCPQVFADTSRIEARSSTAMRCAMSMAAFTERLKELNPSLRVTREAAPRHMDYIAYNSPEVKALSADTASWRKDFRAFEDAHIRPDRLTASLFIRPDEVESPRELMMGLYWIASDMQDVNLSLSFYDIFEPEELYDIWQCINYRMYVCNAAAPAGGGAGPRSAVSLLRNMVEEADRAIHRGSPAATLRFGHDTNLIRLLALMQVEGCCTQESDPARYHTAWQDFRISPMAANLQWVFYRNAAGHVMVKLLHNEREVRLPLESASAPYYDWNSVKQLFGSKMTRLKP